jgi:hypothetical protein
MAGNYHNFPIVSDALLCGEVRYPARMIKETTQSLRNEVLHTQEPTYQHATGLPTARCTSYAPI